MILKTTLSLGTNVLKASTDTVVTQKDMVVFVLYHVKGIYSTHAEWDIKFIRVHAMFQIFCMTTTLLGLLFRDTKKDMRLKFEFKLQKCNILLAEVLIWAVFVLF